MIKKFLLLVLSILFLVYPIHGQNTVVEKKYIQTTDPNAPGYLNNRYALVGRHCMVNRVSSALANVVGGVSNLQNLVDCDLENYASFYGLAKVALGTDPVVSVKDLAHVYAKGTKAGFVLTKNAKSLLELKVVSLPYKLVFYRDGESVGTVTCDQYGEAGVLELKLLGFKNNEAGFEVTATAPDDFDEIGILPLTGLDLNVANQTTIKYAFVGSCGKYSISYEPSGGMSDFCANQGLDFDDIELKSWPDNVFGRKIIDDDPNNRAVIILGGEYSAVAINKDKDNKLIFKKGSTVGFDISKFEILKLGGAIKIKLYHYDAEASKKWKVVQEELVSLDVLKLNLGVEKSSPCIVAEEDFNAIGIVYEGVNVGEMSVFHAFVTLPPDMDEYQPLNVSADKNLCDDEQVDFLYCDEPVKWVCVSRPEGARAIDISEIKAGQVKVEGFDVCGDYIFEARTIDGRSARTKIRYGISPYVDKSLKPWVNNQTLNEKYEVVDAASYGFQGLTVDHKKNTEALITPNLDDYAEYIGGLSLASNKMIVGIRNSTRKVRSDKSLRIGFVIKAHSSILDLNLLQAMCVRVYNGKERVDDEKMISKAKVLSADLVSKDQCNTLRYSITLPAGVEFDMISLWSSGVLKLNLSKIDIFYAYVEDEEKAQQYDDISNEETLISNYATNARINEERLNNVGVAQVTSVFHNVANLVDGSLDTSMSFITTANVASKSSVSVKLGRIYQPCHQIGVYVSDKTYLATVKLGVVFTITTYLGGQEQEKHCDWQTLGLNVVGLGDKNLILWNPTKSYDEIEISINAVANALDYQHNIYGIVIRHDYDGDGIIDNIDEQSCKNEFIIDECDDRLYQKHDFNCATLYLARSLKKNQWATITLPVSLSYNQFVQTFGQDARLARPCDFKPESPDILQFYVKPTIGNNAFLEKEKPYIIRPAIEPVFMEKKLNDGKSICGRFYVIEGVDYDMKMNHKDRFEDIPCVHKDYGSSLFGESVVWNGCFVRNTHINQYSFTFAKGRLFYLDNRSCNILGLRCWMRADNFSFGGEFNSTNAKPWSFAIDGDVEGTATDIVDLRSNLLNTVTPSLYNLKGVLLKSDSKNLENLSRGIYIWKNKKIFVK